MPASGLPIVLPARRSWCCSGYTTRRNYSFGAPSSPRCTRRPWDPNTTRSLRKSDTSLIRDNYFAGPATFTVTGIEQTAVKQYILPKLFVDAAGQRLLRRGDGFSRWWALARFAGAVTASVMCLQAGTCAPLGSKRHPQESRTRPRRPEIRSHAGGQISAGR